MARGRKTTTKDERRLLAIAQDPGQPDEDRAVALTDYARSKRTLPADLAALRRQLLATLERAGRIRADLARSIKVDHSRITRLLAQVDAGGAPDRGSEG